ncbi:MAG: hypothetical protein K9L75_05495 [Spirochaetia bacterium]|nr:hypothetical protein [Spirochaetia bacterium]
MEILQAEPDTCFGCDVCDKTRQSTASGESTITNLIRRHQLRFTASQAAVVLRGNMILKIRNSNLYRYQHFAELPDWLLEEIMDAAEILLKTGLLASSKNEF